MGSHGRFNVTAYLCGWCFYEQCDQKEEVRGQSFKMTELWTSPQHQSIISVLQVTVKLTGLEGESDIQNLTDPHKPVLERGAVDMFLLATPFPLGEVQNLRLQHDNSGGCPSWYWRLRLDVSQEQSQDFVSDTLFLMRKMILPDTTYQFQAIMESPSHLY